MTDYPERLARNEHQRWLNDKKAQGYTYGSVRDDAKKINEFLLPWERLPEEGREKNMVVFKNLSEILGLIHLGLYIRRDGYRNTYELKGAANIPIIFSFTGHRDLEKESEETLRLELKKLFDKFHRRFPHSDLVMLNALADGADMIAAEVALDNHIRVTPVLPCRKDAYRKTFSKEFVDKFDQLFERCVEDLNEYEIPLDEPNYRKCSAYMISHSHMLIAAWDGFEWSEKEGGTYDTLRMGCMGVDYDITEHEGEKYLNNVEDIPAYWIPVKRITKAEPGTPSVENEENCPMYISSLVNSDNAKKCTIDRELSEKSTSCEKPNKGVRYVLESIVDGFKRSLKDFKKGINTVKERKKIHVIDTHKKLDSIGTIKSNCSRYIPDFYYDIFSKIDTFNKDAGTVPETYSSPTSTGAVHRCSTSEDSILDGVYSLGSKPSFESWSKNRAGLNNLASDAGGKPESELSETEKNRLNRVRQTLNKIRFRRYGDATALRFQLAYELSEDNERRNKRMHRFLIRTIVFNYLLFALFMVSGGSLLLISLYLGSMVVGNIVLWTHHGKEEHRKMVEYRCLAESLRTRYYLSILDSKGDLSLSYYDHLRNKTLWVRAALISWDLHCFDDPVSSKIDMEEITDAVHESWVQWGLFHHMDKKRRNSVIFAGNKTTATIAVGGIAIIAVLQIVACLKIITFNLFEYGGWYFDDIVLLSGLTLTSLVTFKLLMITFSTMQKYTSQYKKRIIGSNVDEIHAKVKLYELADTRLREQTSESDFYKTASLEQMLKVLPEKVVPKSSLAG